MLFVAVVVVTDKLNKKLSVTAPGQLNRMSVVGAVASATDQPDTDRRKVMFESEEFVAEPTPSEMQLSTLLVQTIRASFVMESVRIVLYLGNTELVSSETTKITIITEEMYRNHRTKITHSVRQNHKIRRNKNSRNVAGVMKGDFTF